MLRLTIYQFASRRLALGPLRPLRGSRFALGQPDAFGAGESRATTETGMRVSRLAPTSVCRRVFASKTSSYALRATEDKSSCAKTHLHPSPSGLTRTPDTECSVRDTRKLTETTIASVSPVFDARSCIFPCHSVSARRVDSVSVGKASPEGLRRRFFAGGGDAPQRFARRRKPRRHAENQRRKSRSDSPCRRIQWSRERARLVG